MNRQQPVIVLEFWNPCESLPKKLLRFFWQMLPSNTNSVYIVSLFIRYSLVWFGSLCHQSTLITSSQHRTCWIITLQCTSTGTYQIYIFLLNTHCYRNPPYGLWAGSGISFFRSPVLRVPYTKLIGTFNFLTKVTLLICEISKLSLLHDYNGTWQHFKSHLI